MAERVVLAIDPGREKCGLAITRGDAILEHQIASREGLIEAVRAWLERYPVITMVVVGNRTASEEIRTQIGATFPKLSHAVVDEMGSTLEARRLYFADHPRRGWRRLLPLSLQVPPEPYDDYAAVVLARRYLAGSGEYRVGPGREEESPGG